MEPLPSIDKLFSFIKQEESQQYMNNSNVPSVDSAALQYKADSRNFRGPSANNKRPRPYCDHCSKHGHTKATCYKIHGYPSGPQPTRGSNSNASLKGIAEPHVNAAVAPSASFNNLLANLSKKQY